MPGIISVTTPPTSLEVFRNSGGTSIAIDRATGRLYALLSDQTIVDLISGTLVGYGAWDDLRFPATLTKQGANSKPDFDFTDIGLLFPQNNADEIAYIIGQMPHGYAKPAGYIGGTDIKPHVHFHQTSANVPVFKLDYKWFNNGEAVPAGFTTIATTGLVFTYTSGTLAQMAVFPAISGSGKKASSILQMKLYRDDNAVSGDVLVTEFDLHCQSWGQGTRTE